LRSKQTYHNWQEFAGTDLVRLPAN